MSILEKIIRIVPNTNIRTLSLLEFIFSLLSCKIKQHKIAINGINKGEKFSYEFQVDFEYFCFFYNH